MLILWFVIARIASLASKIEYGDGIVIEFDQIKAIATIITTVTRRNSNLATRARMIPSLTTSGLLPETQKTERKRKRKFKTTWYLIQFVS